MYYPLGDAVLRSGETMAMGCTLGPDEAFIERVPQFLSHKNEYCQWHIRASMQQPLDDLETRYYLGRIGDEIVVNIMTVECRGVGILGHVFTQPAHRRKSACTELMARQMQDFRDRGGRCLILGTGYDTHPYRIYRGFGFESIRAGSGDMRYTVEPDATFTAGFFQPGTARAQPLAWGHWPLAACLGSYELPEYLRTIEPPVYGPYNFEGCFYPLKRACETGQAQSYVLESSGGAVGAFAALQPDPRFRGDSFVLDIYGHGAFGGAYGELLGAFTWPNAKASAYADAESEAKIAALEEAGFVAEARLTGQVIKGERKLDVVMLARQ